MGRRKDWFCGSFRATAYVGGGGAGVRSRSPRGGRVLLARRPSSKQSSLFFGSRGACPRRAWCRGFRDLSCKKRSSLNGLSAPEQHPPWPRKWFALQSCRIESLQGLGDDLQATIKRDAAASQRSSFLRLLALGLPLVLLCVGAAAMGSNALLALDQVERKLDRSQASEQKYKRLLLNWAPLSAWVGAVASDDDAIEDAAGDDAAMRKAKTLARLQKSF